MNESIGGAHLSYLVIIIVGVIISVFLVSFAYTKANKAKNIIINTIGEYDGEVLNSHVDEKEISEPNNEGLYDGYNVYSTSNWDNFYEKEVSTSKNEELFDEINTSLSNLGYNMDNKKCSKRKGIDPIVSENGYCIYKIDESDSSGNAYYYYEIETFMVFEIPLFNFSIPVYGQTKNFGREYQTIEDGE